MSIDASQYLANPGYFNVAPHKGPMLIGIAGGASSGKQDVCKYVADNFLEKSKANVTVLSLQSFYRELSDQERKSADNGDFNFDHPSAFDFDALENALKDLVEGKQIELPDWDVRLHKRVGTLQVKPADVILLEGILVLYPPAVRNILNMKVYIDVDSDDRLARRVKGNSLSQNPQGLEALLHQYVRFVKRSHEDFVLPTKQYADIIVPRGMANKPALKLMIDHIRSFLDGKDSYVVSEEKRQPGLIGSPHIGASEILGNKDSQFRLLPK